MARDSPPILTLCSSTGQKPKNASSFEATVGYRPNGKRIVKKASHKTKTGAKEKLKEILRDYEDGVTTTQTGYTVAQAVTDWLANYERIGRDPNTVRTVRGLVENHFIPALGARPLQDLSADDVDEWLAEKAGSMVTTTLRLLHSILRRAINRAQTRDKVKRNVVALRVPRWPRHRTTVQGAHARTGRGGSASRRRLAHVRLHRHSVAHWCTDRGTPSAHLVAR